MLSLLLGATLAIGAPEMIPLEDKVLVGRTAPDFDAVMLDGAPFKLSETRGKPVILAFWASWCGPCRAELPALAEFQKAHPELSIFAVNVDTDKNKANGFLRKVKFDLPVVWDNQAMALGQYDVLSMPTVFLLDSKGTVKHRKTGYSTQKGFIDIETKLAEVK